MGVNDELLAGQAYTIIGNLALVDTIADVYWQIIEDRTLGNALQALDPHVAHDEIRLRQCQRRQQQTQCGRCQASDHLVLAFPQPSILAMSL